MRLPQQQPSYPQQPQSEDLRQKDTLEQPQTNLIPTQSPSVRAAVQAHNTATGFKLNMELLVEYQAKKFVVTVTATSLPDLESELIAKLNILSGTALEVEYYNMKFKEYVMLQEINELTTARIRVSAVQNTLKTVEGSVECYFAVVAVS
jgi:hypothetical protein